MEKTNAIENVNEPIKAAAPTEERLTLETAVKSANISMVRQIQLEIEKKFSLLAELQGKMKQLRDLLSLCHKATDSEGKFDFKTLSALEQEDFSRTLTEFSIGDIKALEKALSNPERERLIDSIKMKIEDVDLPNKTHFLQVQTLLNTRNECYLSARTTLKVLHDAKSRMAQKCGP